MDRKLDKLEFGKEMQTKVNKKDLEMSLETIDTMHRQLSSTIQLIDTFANIYIDNESSNNI